MKKLLITSLLAGTAIVASAETLTFQGGASAGSRVNLTGASATTDVILDSTNGAYYRGAYERDQTVHTIKAISNSSGSETAGDVAIASSMQSRTMTVDVDSASAITAINTNSWTQNYMNFKVVNSNDDYAKTNVEINFGTNFVLSVTPLQSQSFTVDNIKATVSANTFTIGGSNDSEGYSSTFTVGSKANVTWNGNTNIGLSGSATPRYANFNLSGTLRNLSGKWIVGRGALLNIASTGTYQSTNQVLEVQTGGTLKCAGNLKMEGGSTLNVYGKLDITNTTPTSQFNIYTLNTNGTLLQATDSTGNYNGLRIWRTANFNSGANWAIDEILDLQGNIVSGVNADITTAKLYMKEGAHIIIKEEEGKIARLRLWGLSKAYLTQTNAITDQKGNAIRLVSGNGSQSSEYNAEIHLFSEQTFTDIYFDANLKLFLENDLAKLVLNDDSVNNTLGNISESKTLLVYNFSNDKIYVGEKADTLNSVKYVKAYDADNNLVGLTVVNGWLSAVPEPAEWAAIFGAFALGFAVYRRRNSR